MSERDGPTVSINVSCLRCTNQRSEHYQVQGDSGHNVYCTFEDEERFVNNSHWDTPDWCPLMPSFVKDFREALAQREKG